MRALAAVLALIVALIVALSSLTAFAQGAADEFEELSAEFEEVWGEWRQKDIAARRAGASDEEREAIRAEEPVLGYMPRFQAGAERHAGTDGAIPYLQWVFRWASRKKLAAADEALDQLVKDHLAHPSMGRFAFSIALQARRYGFDREKTLAVEERIADAALDPEIRAQALFWRAYVVAGTTSTEAEIKRALADLGKAIELGDAETKQRAEGLQFEVQRLQIGMVVPDIEGEDLAGVAFKLSDYRGKVVMLDFWGDW